MHLRPYQLTAVNALRAAYAAGRRAPLLVAPTGSGKTAVFSYIAKHAALRGTRTLINVHRVELLRQASERLTLFGVPHGLIAPGERFQPQTVQVGMVQTLARRKLDWQPGLIIIDEAHHAVAGQWRQIIERWPAAKILGVTATPCRSDGVGLGDVFDEMTLGPSVKELTASGVLAPFLYYAPDIGFSAEKLSKRGGDFAPEAAAERLMRPQIVGGVVKYYRQLLNGAPTVAFCTTVQHAEHVAEALRGAGYQAAAVHGGLDAVTRQQTLADLERGALHVVTSCNVISEGTDLPCVTGALLLRPTESTGLYLQQVGRALREAPGKERAIILDHVGNAMRHGLPDEDREWSLQGAGQGKPRDAAPVRQCPCCFAAHKPLPECPECGHQYVSEREPIKQVDGELALVTEMKRQNRIEIGKARTKEQLKQIAAARGYKPGWVFAMMKARGMR